MFGLNGKWLGFLLVGGIGIDSVRGICVGFVVLLMNCSLVCFYCRWYKIFIGILIGVKERFVCYLFIFYLFWDCLVKDCSINY